MYPSKSSVKCNYNTVCTVFIRLMWINRRWVETNYAGTYLFVSINCVRTMWLPTLSVSHGSSGLSLIAAYNDTMRKMRCMHAPVARDPPTTAKSVLERVYYFYMYCRNRNGPLSWSHISTLKNYYILIRYHVYYNINKLSNY